MNLNLTFKYQIIDQRLWKETISVDTIITQKMLI